MGDTHVVQGMKHKEGRERRKSPHVSRLTREKLSVGQPGTVTAVDSMPVMSLRLTKGPVHQAHESPARTGAMWRESPCCAVPGLPSSASRAQESPGQV